MPDDNWTVPIKEPSFGELSQMPEGSWRIYLSCKLGEYHGEVVQMAAVQNAHGQRIEKIERRCAGRRWQGKLLWACLAASVSALASNLWTKLHGG